MLFFNKIVDINDITISHELQPVMTFILMSVIISDISKKNHPIHISYTYYINILF